MKYGRFIPFQWDAKGSASLFLNNSQEQRTYSFLTPKGTLSSFLKLLLFMGKVVLVLNEICISASSIHWFSWVHRWPCSTPGWDMGCKVPWVWAELWYTEAPPMWAGFCSGAGPLKHWDEIEIDQRCAIGYLSSLLSLSGCVALGLFPFLQSV